ncbi:hypothetical protein CsSME_00014344 [Camellia sinensis var. sinensis]
MRTRQGVCDPKGEMRLERAVKRQRDLAGESRSIGKRLKRWPQVTGDWDVFDELPDDLVVSIRCKRSSTVSCPILETVC